MPGSGPQDWWTSAQSELGCATKLKATGDLLQAYHHAGQAVEFMLKAIFLKKKNLSEWPDEQKGANWHDLRLIAAAANVQCDVKQKGLYANWLTARDWDSNARFPGNKKPQQEVNDLITAVCHHQDGVMKWLDSLYHAL